MVRISVGHPFHVWLLCETQNTTQSTMIWLLRAINMACTGYDLFASCNAFRI